MAKEKDSHSNAVELEQELAASKSDIKILEQKLDHFMASKSIMNVSNPHLNCYYVKAIVDREALDSMTLLFTVVSKSYRDALYDAQEKIDEKVSYRYGEIVQIVKIENQFNGKRLDEYVTINDPKKED